MGSDANSDSTGVAHAPLSKSVGLTYGSGNSIEVLTCSATMQPRRPFVWMLTATTDPLTAASGTRPACWTGGSR